ncbi:hypothetical protein [Nocardia sp. NPDC051832]|uniref:variant leucine-rich repeat-containing protein n=1 Tax=Nocardia sp. NPDC051832 TaxID=3155673 RepID=UPI00342CFC0B
MQLAARSHDDPVAPIIALLKRDQLPASVARRVADDHHDEVRRRLAAHPSTPDEVRCLLAEDAEPGVRAEVAAWPNALIDFSRIGPVAAPPLPVEVYRALVADTSPLVRAALGRNHRVPAAIRAVLAGDRDPEVRRCAALYPLPLNVLHRLIGDAERRTVGRTALMTAASDIPEATIPWQLAELFLEDGDYRETAVARVTLTPALLERLWAEPDLRVALARNPGLPVARMWACLREDHLRVALTENPSLPADLVEALVDTGDPDVHRELLRRAELPDTLARRLTGASEDDEPLPLAESLMPEHASLERRLSYLDHANPAFRRALAFSFDLPDDAIRQLSEDPDFTTRLLICERHTEISPQALIGVIDRWHGHTRSDLLRHPRLPATALPRYAAADEPGDRIAIASRPDLTPDLVHRFLTDPSAKVRRTAAANPRLLDDRLHELLADPDSALREGAAANPALPSDEFTRLLTDN